MDIQIKDMKLILTISGNTLTRVVEDLDGNAAYMTATIERQAGFFTDGTTITTE